MVRLGYRNNMIFNGKATPHQVLLNRVDRLAKDYGKYSKQIYSHQSAPAHSSPKVWTPSPVGIHKINVDASLAVDGWIGLGAIARDSRGRVLFAASRRVRAFWSPEVSEAKAIEMGVRLGRNLA